MIDFNNEIRLREEALSTRLNSMREEALSEFQLINGPSTIHKMHAHIGRNNNTFVDSVRMQFSSPEDFIARWVDGLREEVIERQQEILKSRKFGGHKKTIELLPLMLQNDILKSYIFLFLERNFYRNYFERVRAKPEECLWQLWFGQGSLCWGLLISPEHRLGEWTNDKSQMRRESYSYWTIGHVMATGLVTPESDEPMKFASVLDFLQFYKLVLSRISNSEYEKQISTKYLSYVAASPSPKDIPLLIPELRYAGKGVKHLYRLDYCVLNSFTMKKTGFEISPASSHMAISGIKTKSQTEINAGLAEKWAKEADKRNRYYRDFGISIITFTDAELKSIESCFDEIVPALEEKPRRMISLLSAEQELKEVFNAI